MRACQASMGFRMWFRVAVTMIHDGFSEKRHNNPTVMVLFFVAWPWSRCSLVSC